MVKILTIGHDVCGQMSDRKMLTKQTAWLTVAYRTREGKMFLFTGSEGSQFNKIQNLSWGKKILRHHKCSIAQQAQSQTL